MHITIIDSDEITSRILMEYLFDQGIMVSHSPNIEGGILLLRGRKPDILMVDISMHENAVLFLDCIYPKATKTVVMSTNPKTKETVKADYYLDKPFTLDDIDRIIQEVKNSEITY